jgi:hypothetical protein
MSGGEIRRSPTLAPVEHAAVKPILLDPSRQSPQAAIQAVNADSEKANMMNNMHGGWVPNPKTKVVKSKKVKEGGSSKSRTRRRRRRRHSQSRRLNASDARVSRRLRMRMLQRRIKRRKSRRRGTRQMQMQMQMRGGSGGQVPLQPQPAVQTVPQHGTSCTAGDTNCAGNITQGILSVNAQAVANSHGDNVSAQKV